MAASGFRSKPHQEMCKILKTYGKEASPLPDSTLGAQNQLSCFINVTKNIQTNTQKTPLARHLHPIDSRILAP
jgi:hypothetical protein